MTGPVAVAPLTTLLRELLEGRLDEAGRRWWTAAVASATEGGGELAERFTGASRRVGKRPLALTAAERARLAG